MRPQIQAKIASDDKLKRGQTVMDSEIKQAAFRYNLQRINQKYPAGTLSFKEASLEIGFPSDNAAYLAKGRGRYPLPLIDVGGRERVLVVEVAAWLSGVDIKRSSLIKRRGAPTKEERLAKKMFDPLSNSARK